MNKFLFSAGTCIAFCVSVYSLQAPYLIDVIAQSTKSTGLTWRNNSTAYDSIYILRKGGTESTFKTISAAKGTTTSFIDTNLIPSQLYRYALYARNASEVSDTSNTDSAMTFPPDSSFYGKLTVTWDTARRVVQIIFKDSLCTGKRLKIFRSEHYDFYNTSTLVVDTTIVNATMPNHCQITIANPPVMNKWYIYGIDEYFGNRTSTVFDTIFALDLNTFFRQDSAIIAGRILSEYPVYTDRQTLWAAKSGDSVFIKENNTADSNYTIFNVKDMNNPAFEAYRSFQKPFMTPSGSTLFNNSLFYGGTFYQITRNGPVVVSDYGGGFYAFINDTSVIVNSSHLQSSLVFSVKKNMALDTMATLPFALSCFSGNNCPIFGSYRNFAWRNTAARYSTDLAVDLLQFISKNTILQCTIKNCRLDTMTFFNGYPSRDTLFTKSAFSFFDTTKHLAFLINSTRLTICEYSVEPNTNAVSRKRSGIDASPASPGFRVSNEGNRLLVHHLRADPATLTIYTCAGRVLLRKKIGYEKDLCFSLKGFPRGVYVIGLKSTHRGNEVATFSKN